MHNNERIYVDVHVLQTVPPSCVNRDDTGSPKTAVYGGVTRARVSSQAWKRAMRLKFREMLSAGDVGQRTKLVVDLIAGKMLELQPDLSEKKAQQMAQKVLEAAGVEVKEDKEKLENRRAVFHQPRSDPGTGGDRPAAGGWEARQSGLHRCLKQHACD